MKVIFRVDSSLEMGTGHVMRCLALAQSLKENGNDVEFICRKHCGNLIEKINLIGFFVYELEVLEGSETDTKLIHSHWLGSTPKYLEEIVGMRVRLPVKRGTPVTREVIA